MNDVPLGAIVAILGALILVGGGLWRRGMSRDHLLRMALLWGIILAAMWLVVTLGLRSGLI